MDNLINEVEKMLKDDEALSNISDKFIEDEYKELSTILEKEFKKILKAEILNELRLDGNDFNKQLDNNKILNDVKTIIKEFNFEEFVIKKLIKKTIPSLYKDDFLKKEYGELSNKLSKEFKIHLEEINKTKDKETNKIKISKKIEKIIKNINLKESIIKKNIKKILEPDDKNSTKVNKEKEPPKDDEALSNISDYSKKIYKNLIFKKVEKTLKNPKVLANISDEFIENEYKEPLTTFRYGLKENLSRYLEYKVPKETKLSDRDNTKINEIFVKPLSKLSKEFEDCLKEYLKLKVFCEIILCNKDETKIKEILDEIKDIIKEINFEELIIKKLIKKTILTLYYDDLEKINLTELRKLTVLKKPLEPKDLDEVNRNKQVMRFGFSQKVIGERGKSFDTIEISKKRVNRLEYKNIKKIALQTNYRVISNLIKDLYLLDIYYLCTNEIKILEEYKRAIKDFFKDKQYTLKEPKKSNIRIQYKINTKRYTKQVLIKISILNKQELYTKNYKQKNRILDALKKIKNLVEKMQFLLKADIQVFCKVLKPYKKHYFILFNKTIRKPPTHLYLTAISFKRNINIFFRYSTSNLCNNNKVN